jgi:DNA-binding NarL/FixJ family response regulator
MPYLSSLLLTRPQVVVLDIALPGASGFEAMRRMLARDSQARILVCSMHDDPVYIERPLGFGAVGYVTKACVGDVLLDAIRSVARGDRFLNLGYSVEGVLLTFIMSVATLIIRSTSPKETSNANRSPPNSDALTPAAGGRTVA